MNLLLFAQAAQSDCTLNGQPIDCAELAEKAKPFIGIGLGILAVIIILSIISFIFWLMMLIHATKHNSPNKNTWIIILVISFIMGFCLIGALVYYFAEKKKAELAPQTPDPLTSPTSQFSNPITTQPIPAPQSPPATSEQPSMTKTVATPSQEILNSEPADQSKD